MQRLSELAHILKDIYLLKTTEAGNVSALKHSFTVVLLPESSCFHLHEHAHGVPCVAANFVWRCKYLGPSTSCTTDFFVVRDLTAAAVSERTLQHASDRILCARF